ncbi:tRNA-splicing endonuclease subunit Sen54 [Chlorella sorokiniana]|uniref:tRNA-splicing endonuclease subunit Sen54 n=1 Tax=Chlorella sorokiniana TaxID=3076 RepID=A0A2P6TM40_CHLSO|nr:tRNA-splicing endonuclease subunit Sen54 [Chlorella sorokiniana]|eukprot:PRW45365.1 tRNA-splicing endonuclease subunit Sen54 [Chlorella sorokiniana]
MSAAEQRRAFAAAIFRRGQKGELFDDGEELDAGEELRSKLDDLHAVWALARSGRDLAAAIWRPELGLAEVVLLRGKVLSHMGFTKGPKHYLFPEEAAYLVDRANLLLFLDLGAQKQRLLSLQECLDLLAGAGVPVDRYLVFCKLLRAGYIVQRHPARWLLKPTEDPTAPWAGWGMDPAAADGAAAAQDVAQGPAAAAGQQQQQQRVAPAIPAGPPRKRRKVELQLRSMGWWAAGSDGQQQQAEQQQAEQQQAEQQQQQQAGGGDGGTGLPWLRGCLPADFVAGLPRCKLVPDATQRARADFPRMGPLAAVPLADMLPSSGPGGGRHLLHYDVFAANSQFSRKAPGTPAFTISVQPADRLPTPQDAVAADAAAGGVPVRFCTVEKGDICFYGLAHVELRSILQ